MTTEWLAQVRPGYEPEFTREFKGTVITSKPGRGWCIVSSSVKVDRKPWRALTPSMFIFARQLFMVFAEIEDVTPENIVARAASAAQDWRKTERMAVGFHSLFVEAPDSQEGRETLTRFQGLQEAMEAELKYLGLTPSSRRGLPRLHLFLDATGTVWLGLSDPVTGNPWPMGAPKIKLPPEAPSRSARKLEEAIQLFIPKGEWEARLDAGMRAVDLGASPGGWSWQLARRGMLVEAIDNGPMDKEALELGLVTHIQADGYIYKPARSVDWLVCDIVGAAPRVARLVANWVERTLFKEAIFNLKLGAGDKKAQIDKACAIIAASAKNAGVFYTLKLKHLYHDRDEVTAHLQITGKTEKPPMIPKLRELAKPSHRSGKGPKVPRETDKESRGAKPRDAARDSKGGKPKDTGKDSRAGKTRDAARDSRSGKPKEAVKESRAGKSKDAGRDSRAGKTRDAARDSRGGKPKEAGKESRAGKTRDAARDSKAGKPRDTGRDSRAGKPKDAEKKPSKPRTVRAVQKPAMKSKPAAKPKAPGKPRAAKAPARARKG